MYNLQEQQSVTQELQSVPVIQETPKYSTVQIKRPKSGKKSDTNSHCKSEKKVNLSRIFFETF